MKIIFLIPHLKISGGGRIGLNYAHFLAQKGYQVNVIVTSKKLWRRYPANLLNFKVRWFKGFAAKVLRVKDLGEDNLPDADIIVACAWQMARLMNTYSAKKGIQFQFIMHDERLYHGQREEIEKVYKYPIKKIAISSWIKERLKKDFNINAELLITPVDFNLFHSVDVKKNNQEIRILMLHHTYKWKGVKEGLRAFSNAKKQIPNLKLILFGARKEKIDIPHDEYYYKLPQKKLAHLYSSCDIFLCPSWYEGLGMPAMEAMACGCAVVTYDTGGSRDYAFDGKTAFVAKSRDVKDLSNKLLLAVKNGELREKIAQGGYKFIHNDIETWEESVNRLENIFKKEKKYVE